MPVTFSLLVPSIMIDESKTFISIELILSISFNWYFGLSYSYYFEKIET